MAYIKRRTLSRFFVFSSTWVLFLCLQLSLEVPVAEARYAAEWEGYHRGLSRELLSRYTLDGKSTSDRFCAADSEGNCHWEDYGKALAAIGIPMLVLSLLSLLCLPCFLIFRCCCNLYGGRQPNSGFFCPNPASTFAGYSLKEVWTVKTLLLLFSAGVVVCAIFGFVANTKVVDGVHHTGDVVINTAHFVLEKCQVLVDTLETLPYVSSATDTLQGVLDEANHIIDKADQFRDKVNWGNNIRSSIMIASFAFPLALVLVASLGGLLNISVLAMLAGIIFFLASSLMWLSGAVHYVFGTVLDDACNELHRYIHDGERDNVLDQFLPCGTFDDVYNTTKEAMDEVVSTACNSTDTLCSYPAYVNCPPVACAEDTLSDYSNATLTDYVIGCDLGGGNVECPYTGSSCSSPFVCYQKVLTVRQCASQCNNTEFKSLSQEIIVYVDDYAIFVELLNDFIYPLLNCTFVNEAFDDLDNAMCHEFVNGIKDIGISSLSLASLLVPATFLAIMGYKRFNTKHLQDSTDPTNFELP